MTHCDGGAPGRAALLLFLLLGLGSCGGARDPAPAPSPSPFPVAGAAGRSWHAAPAMRHARAAHAVAVADDAIFAFAGTSAGGVPVLAVERFDGTSWSEEAVLPGGGLNAPAAAFLDGRVYVIGGFSTVTNVPVADVLTYDPDTRTWGRAAPLPAPRGGHAAVVLDGRIHVLGGGNSVSTLADHSVYDPATDAWTERAPLSRAKGSPAAVVFEGRLWCLGGRSGPSDFGDVEIWDAATDRWSEGPALVPRGSAGAVVLDGTILVVGGESQAERRCLDDVLRLDPAARAWRRDPPMPTARNFARAVLFRGDVLVIGGSLEPATSHAPVGSAVVERLGR